MSSVLYDAPGPKARRRVLIGSVLGGLLILAVVYLLYRRLDSQGIFEARRWDVFQQRDVWNFLWKGLQATLKAAALATVLATLLGVLLAVLRMSKAAPIRIGTGVVIELFRGLPVVLLMLAGALLLPVSLFWAVVIGLTIYNGAVISEILRAGILSLPKGQSEAAYAVGLTHGQTLGLVLLPQAVRRMLPSLISQVVVLLKDTSLGYIVGYLELLRSVQNLRDFFGNRYIFSVFIVAAGIYIAVNLLLSRVAVWVERRGMKTAAGGVVPVVATGAVGVYNAPGDAGEPGAHDGGSST
jgi:glutamate transport system permease protein